MRKSALLTASLLLPAALSFGSAFQVNVQGVRQLAMGGTGVSRAWDASTIFYNPAGLSTLNNFQAYGSINFLVANTSYAQTPTQGYTYDSKTGFYTPFNLYVGGPFPGAERIGIGLGVYTPFGTGLTWDDNWAGQYITRSIQLQSFFIQPTVSYYISDAVSIGAGFVYALGNVKLERGIPLNNAEGTTSSAALKGNANGIGFNAGIQVKASDRLNIGFSYRSKVNMEVDNGDVTFTVPSVLRPNFPNGSFTAELPLPTVTTLGVSYKVTDELTLQADINFTGWKAYDTLRFDYELNTSTVQDSRAPRNYENRFTYRLGAHYQMNDRLSLMAGGAYDPTPVVDNYVSPDLPDANHWIVSAGAAYKATSRINIMAAIEYNTTVKRDAQYLPDNFNGMYQTKVVVPTVGITYEIN